MIGDPPKTMKALVIEGPGKLAVKQLPIPKPKDGEVLIKVMAAPINPSDTYFIRDGSYSQIKKAPCIAGFQGSGVVIENGGGFIGWTLMNKKVAFTPTQQSGSYTQFAVAKSTQCMGIDEHMSFQQASMSFVNPMTAMAILDYTKQHDAKAIIINAAASSLGRMLNRYLPPEQIQLINIVRRQEQRQILKKEGATHILNSQDQDFEEKLKQMIKKLNATVGFDAIGGTATGQLLKCMPKFSTVYVYGLLSGEPMNGVDISDIIYNGKTIKGLLLPHWIESKGIIRLLPSLLKLRKLLFNQLRSQIAVECSLESVEKNIKVYLANMSKGKVIVSPYLIPTQKENEKVVVAEKKETESEVEKKQLQSQSTNEAKSESKGES